MKRWNVPGSAVAIVKDGKVVAMKGYGIKETGKPDKVDEKTQNLLKVTQESLEQVFKR